MHVALVDIVNDQRRNITVLIEAFKKTNMMTRKNMVDSYSV